MHPWSWRSAVLSCCLAACGSSTHGTASEKNSAETRGVNTLPAQCVRPLSESRCAATYDGALAATQCPPQGAGSWSVDTCGALHFVYATVVDVAQTCVYDSTNALVATRTCTKTTDECNCLGAGDVDQLGCQDPVHEDLCPPNGRN